jgi:hypothetical protein
MLTSDQIIVMGMNFVSDEMVEMRYQYKEEFVEEFGRTNVVIAAYSTVQAHLKLYSYLEQLALRALYTDTDSVGYTSRPGEWKPELGDYLGYLTDEVPNNSIIEFFTGGPKNYAYKIAKPDKDGNTTICKVRGITLNYKNYLTINFDAIKDMVINNSDDVKNVMDDFKITRDHKRLLTVHQDKDYKIVFDKRVITQDHST